MQSNCSEKHIQWEMKSKKTKRQEETNKLTMLQD